MELDQDPGQAHATQHPYEGDEGGGRQAAVVNDQGGAYGRRVVKGDNGEWRGGEEAAAGACKRWSTTVGNMEGRGRLVVCKADR
jgi:hypothetical protein